ncbi:hypothetical protein AJ79_10012 [Helicocarpus griseus UAMH5409]|uniref:Adenosylmethionine-8-amino-7-oxononanoate transaminase n=1 Tax=Helicocarpus griseus UAMH5409 TaxID=1447875 RepID=A0A2B7WG64_9EURO|nr:hypothetical protein AJ79_10012 [Helicocarpus griseus UAMH5409]
MDQSAVFHRSLEKSYPTAVRGEGVYLITDKGQKILDGCCGAAVSSVGHGNTEVIEAVVAQARKMAFAHSSFFTSDSAEELARVIINRSDNAFSKVTFLCSGSEAVDSALKIARQYHLYNGEPERVNFIGRNHSYHGNTLGALAAGNNTSRRDPFAPILSPVFHHVSRCFYDTDGIGLEESEYEDRLIAEFENKINALGPKTVAAVIVEPVVGSTLGTVPATATYLPRLKELCSRHGILVIFDEVMCGMGRVGTYHAWQSLGGIAPDLQTIGKGLGAGYQPLSAVLIGKRVYDMFEEHSKGSNKFLSGHTFQGHSMACAGALTVQKILERDNLVFNVQERGLLLESVLREGLSSYIKDYDVSLRGLGLFRTVDFGQLAASGGGRPLASEVSEECFKQGAAVYLCSGAVDALLFAPPFIISEDEIYTLANIFSASLKSVLDRRQVAR